MERDIPRDRLWSVEEVSYYLGVPVGTLYCVAGAATRPGMPADQPVRYRQKTDIKINLVSPGFTSTALNNFAGTKSVEHGSREVVRVALLGPDGPTNTFTRWEDTTIPW